MTDPGPGSWKRRRFFRRLWPALVAAVLLLAAILIGRAFDRGAPGVPAGVVSSASPEASAAGAEILAAGGNAADAAVAVAFALFVTEPAGSGLGGQTSLLIHPHDGPPVVVNGTSFAPRALPASVTAEDVSGRRASTVPNSVSTLAFVLERFGSGKISWERALAPSIRYAEQGFALGRFRHAALAKYGDKLGGDPVSRQVFLAGDGAPLSLGERVRQPRLARTLRRLASAGAGDFYRGQIARAIAADMAEHGGWITAADLSAVAPPRVAQPIQGRYRDYRVYSLPPPAGGWVVAQMLAMLQESPEERMRVGSVSRRRWMAQVLRAGHAERAAHPIADLERYRNDVRDRLAGSRRLADSLGHADAGTDAGTDAGETTHFSLVDGAGTAVAVTQSLNAYFGARVSHPELGFLYNDYMHEFRLDEPKHPFALKPSGMPYSSMAATILARKGRPVLALGSPGSARIISAVVQVASHWVDAGQNIEAAVAAARIHPRPDGVLATEVALEAPLQKALSELGMTTHVQRSGLGSGDRDPYFGGVHAVALQGRQWTGAADPRRDGTVVRASRPAR